MEIPTWRSSAILGVKRVRQAAEYYRDVLGFSLDPEHGVFQPSEDEPDGVYAIVKREGVWVHFQIRRGEIPERERGKFERDLYVYIPDVDALYEEFKTSGANIVQPPTQAPYGIREMEIVDLNGMRITFGEFSS